MELLTIPEAAQVMRVSPITVRRHIAQGEIEAVRVGRGVRISKESLERFIKPVTPAKRHPGSPAPRGRALRYDDPLWRLVGSVTDARPTDSTKKYQYLAEASAPRRKA